MKVDVVVDAGNSCIKWGRCAGGAVVEVAVLSASDPEAWEAQVSGWPIEEKSQWIVSGSNPLCRDRLAKWLAKENRRVGVLTSHGQLPITVNVKQPEKVGLDRLLNAVAVNARKPKGMAAVIVDAGTAATVDYVDEAGVFQGGTILPGIAMMAVALHEYTAALPLIEVNELKQLRRSHSLPGKSTMEAMALGVMACFQGGVERVAREYIKLAAERCVIYVGGGDGSMVDAEFFAGERHLWPEMTLEGIRIAGEQLSN